MILVGRSSYLVRLNFVSKSLLATVEPGYVCPKEMKFWKVRVVIFLTEAFSLWYVLMLLNLGYFVI